MNPLEAQKKKIILVEDEADLRIVYSTVLMKAEYDVQIAPDGDLALDLIKKLPWDLLILDIMLPKHDGLAIMKEISANNLKKGKILMLTQLNNENIIQDAFKYGADAYIIKSEITPGKLVDEVKALLV
jgi:DNA-binding response OmpR family regulator